MATQCLKDWLLNEIATMSGMKVMHVFLLVEADIFTTRDEC
jgi:hypothetical protein